MSSTVVLAETVRKAADADVGRLADTLAAAFFTDPVMSWCYPDADQRSAILPAAFRLILEAARPHGGVETVADEIAGAIWIPPAAEIDEEQLAVDLGRVSGPYAERVFTLLELLDAHHPQHEPHQYLFVLGTRPGWQSRGIGSALLRSVLADCDSDGVPAYLEATSERNRQLYARHRFDVTDVVTLPDGPPLWYMWRNPGATS